MRRRPLLPLLGAGIALAAAAAVLLSRPSGPTDPYFNLDVGQGFSGWAVPGELAWAGVADITVRPGDTVTLLGLEGSPSSVLVGGLYAPLSATEGSMGFLHDSIRQLGDLDAYRDLAGVVIHPADGYVGIVASLVGPASDTTVDQIHLRYRVNDGPEQRQWIPSVIHICSGSSSAACPAPDPPNPDAQ